MKCTLAREVYRYYTLCKGDLEACGQKGRFTAPFILPKRHVTVLVIKKKMMKHVLNTSETQTEQSVIDDRRRQEIQGQGQKRRRDKEKLEPRPQVNTERRE